ncbi:amino acid/amide ABC transporter substrate-binding protein (HAAT family) [Saccharopolyspora erythraea NRRL 2338]|uniref:ABC transporter, substrate binding protein n=2 Tax=Saccharopolyspora erythraea TaxID=1836 RepID=A4FKS5_SACEN|nr:ABC transporter substrate-binding protein [Saccharopolyspora erythraea]PFG98289.1 amino acid/amide ABC transporter substrate-binding protein (HAAT family) [Saccharopolyspora erythraea NRRL 2338]QRK88375.1 ABC transporter substrate-binding protein [Saccharopolyspora erythraea]CAM04650.1 ABC transporter, substrate binding protein [Saccharopolyspora erythraea NRRL 2338]
MSESRGRKLTTGVVVARTGRLSKLGDPLQFAMDLLAPKLRRITNSGRQYEVRLVSRDSRSEPTAARTATRELVQDEGAAVVVTLAGTQVLPAVADTCEELGVPCVSSTFPWQVYYYGRGATADRPFRWTYHFCWGLGDIAGIFADMWQRVGPEVEVGALWNDDQQGNWSRHREHGFLPVAEARGHELVDAPAYHEPATDFDDQIARFRSSGVEVITSTATAADLALFRKQAAESGLFPRLITCSRWLAYPSGPDLAEAKVATLVYWTPRHPYRSSIDGMRPDGLVQAYERQTGNQWLQPLGLAYALFEVAAHALSTASDPTERGSVAEAISTTRLETIAGVLDWTRGPVPNVATIPLAGGQWQPGTHHHPHDLAIVSSGVPGLRVEADLELLR